MLLASTLALHQLSFYAECRQDLAVLCLPRLFSVILFLALGWWLPSISNNPRALSEDYG